VSHPYAGLVLDNTEGDQLADVMGEKRVLMHQSHGVIVCAETVAACFDILYYLERVGLGCPSKPAVVDSALCATDPGQSDGGSMHSFGEGWRGWDGR